MEHVSLDLETMGQSPNSAIVAIGAYHVNVHAPPEDEPNRDRAFYTRVDLGSCLKHGLQIDASTVYWWLGQPGEARNAIAEADRRDLSSALGAFSQWLRARVGDADDTQLWSHATFDAVILANAYRALGMWNPIKYTNMVDLRTLRHFPPFSTGTVLGADKHDSPHAHHAAYDAFYQGKDVVRAMQAAAWLTKAWDAEEATRIARGQD